jgi:hypothetical protein
MSLDQPKFPERLLSQEAERRLSSQLDQVDSIKIDVQTDILKIFQGQLDAVSLAGEGLVVQDQIRVQEIHLQTDSINFNPLSVIFGQIQLNAPVNAMAKIVITEADINLALNSEFIYTQDMELCLDGRPVKFQLKKIQISLGDNQEIECNGEILMTENVQSHNLEYTAIIKPPLHASNTSFKDFRCLQEKGISLDLITALMQKIKELINLSYFQWHDIGLLIKDITIAEKKLILIVEAIVKQIPPIVNTLSST